MLHYLARYTHRVAISNQRILNVADDHVTFRWKDYRHGSQPRAMTIRAEEFLRRFFLHVLPKGFVRIRFFGLLAARRRAVDLARCRRALDAQPDPPLAPGSDEAPASAASWPCPRCGAIMRVIERLTLAQILRYARLEGILFDTS